MGAVEGRSLTGWHQLRRTMEESMEIVIPLVVEAGVS